MRPWILVVLAACDAPPVAESEWARFNAEDDTLVVEVTAAPELGAPLSRALRSSSGEVEVGEASMTPGSGPIGTTHEVRVDVNSAFAARVERVEVVANSGDRGEWTIQLEQDSADAGLWIREVTSFGDEGEVRSDVFTFDLYELKEVAPVASEAE